MSNRQQVQLDAKQQLAGAGIEMPALDARLLVQHVLQLTHEALIAEPHADINEAQRKAIDECIARRLQHEPVSRITGEREFYGRRFIVTPDVLDPRPDTETLIDQVLGIAREMPAGNRPLRILDLGTGSGAIIVTLMAELGNATGTATDISDTALNVARMNAEQLSGYGRIEFVKSSWFDKVTGRYDIIVSNPPYIVSLDIAGLPHDVANYDPLIALDGGADGLDAYRKIVPGAFERLESGGHLCVEIGAGQGGAVANLFKQYGFTIGKAGTAVSCDLAGQDRIASGRKQSC